MTLLKWLYRRVGQMTCFTTGTLFLIGPSQGYGGLEVGFAIAGAAFLATGLVLRAQMISRLPNPKLAHTNAAQ